jgi:hypothetical protein
MIYVVRERCTRLIKAGYARSDLEHRLASYGTHSPGGVDLLFVREGTHDHEGDAHARLAPWHFRAEWFSCSAYVAVSVAESNDLGERWLTPPRAAGIVRTLSAAAIIRRAGEDGAVVTQRSGATCKHFISRDWVDANVGLTRRQARGEQRHNAKLTEADVLAMRAKYAAGETVYAIAALAGVTQSCAENAISGKSWAHVPGAVVLVQGRRPAHGTRNGRATKPESYSRFRGETHPKSKLTDQQVRDVRRRVSAGETQSAVARELGVHTSTVHLIVKGHNWPQVA